MGFKIYFGPIVLYKYLKVCKDRDLIIRSYEVSLPFSKRSLNVLGVFFVHSTVETRFQYLNHSSSVSDLPLVRDQSSIPEVSFFSKFLGN
jgi:hypothetical protein